MQQLLLYLSNFWGSLKLLLINWKVELKLKRTNHCVLSTKGNGDTNADHKITIFPIKVTKLFDSAVT